ncbi:MAG: YfhO family protein [Micrococcales bacterium]|nr:YfhO family protein [Micrococcales bacterium]
MRSRTPSTAPGRPAWLLWLARNVTALAAWGSVLAFTALTIGPALAGRGVFLGTDVLTQLAPWRDAVGLHPPTNTWIGDTIDSQVPKNQALATALRAGSNPWWNPYIIGGTPLGSIPGTGLMSPMSWAWFLVPASYATGLTKLIEITVAVVGMTLLCRRLGLSARAGAVGGLVYVASGFMIAWTNWQHTRVAALIPLAFWATDRLLMRRRWRDTIPLAVIVAAMLMLSFPAVVGYAAYAIVVFAVVRMVAVRAPLRTWLRALLLGGAAGALGIALCAWQMLPFINEAMTTIDFEARQATPGHHLWWSSVASTLVPQMIGDVANQTESTWLSPFNPVESFSYLGAGALVLICTAVLARPRRGSGWVPAYAVGGMLVGAWLVYQGGAALGLVQNLPVFSNNFIGRVRSVIGFFAALAAAIGFQALVRRADARDGTPKSDVDAPPTADAANAADGEDAGTPAPARRRTATVLLVVRWVLVVVLIGGIGLLVVRGLDLVPPHVEARLRVDALVAATALAGSGLLVLLAFATRRRFLAVVAGVALPLVVMAQAVPVARTWWPISDKETFYPVTQTHQYLLDHIGHDRYAAAGWTMYPATSSFYGLRAVTGHSFHQPEWKALLLAADEDAMATRTFSLLDFPAMSSPVLDRMAVRYAVTDPGAAPAGTPEPAATVTREQVVQGAVLSVPVTGPLSGVQVILPKGAQPSGESELHVRVLAEDGGVVTQTSRPLPATTDPYGTWVALAAEDVAPDATVRLELTVDGVSELTVQADDSGTWAPVVVRPDPDDGLTLVDAGDATVYERTTAAPRIRWAPDAVVVTDEQERVDLIASGDLDPSTVVLEHPEDDQDVPGDAQADVTVLEDDGGVVSARVDADGGGWLVFAEAVRTKGWGVTVDGVERTLVDADEAMGAVYVDPGSHVVRFSYDPPGLRTGAVLSVTAGGVVLVSLVVIAVGALRRRRRGADEEAGGAPAPGGAEPTDSAELTDGAEPTERADEAPADDAGAAGTGRVDDAGADRPHDAGTRRADGDGAPPA